MSSLEAPTDAVPENRIKAIICSYEELISVIGTAAIPAEVRILIALRNGFPYIHEYLRNKADLVMYDAATEYHAAIAGSRRDMVMAPNTHRYSVYVCLPLLTPAHSTDNKTVIQLQKRMSAAYASAAMSAPTNTEVTALINAITWKSGDVPPVVYGALGHAISVDQNMEFL